MRFLRGVLLLAPTVFGCKVYDETLLQRSDAARTDRAELTDLGADAADATIDASTDANDAPAVDVSDVGPTTDAMDVVALPDVVVAPDVVDAPDVRDVPADDPPSCEPELASGAPCIEPVLGHDWRSADPRMVAPRAIAATGDRILVSDRGSGRVLGFELAAPMRPPVVTVGNGVVGALPSSGAPTTAAMGEITAMAAVPGGDLLLADATTRQVLRVSGGRVEALPMLAFQTAPGGVAWAADTGELYVTGDNRVWVASIQGDGGAPTPLAGLPCGTNCTVTFNGDNLPGTSTALGTPGGIDIDGEYVYFADRENCRVRRFRRRDPDRIVTTVAGTECDPTADPFGGMGSFATPTQLRLGPVSDVKLGADGSIYFIDDARCAVFGITPARMSGAQPIPRIVAGSAQGCGQGTNALGRLGALGVTSDRSAVLFVDTQFQRVGRITGTANGGSPVVDFPIAPGPIPAAGESSATARVGVPQGIAVGGNGSTFYLSGSAEGRAYRLNNAQVRVLFGSGFDAPAVDALDIASVALPPSRVEGASLSQGRTLFGLPDQGVIVELLDGNLRRLAGRYPAIPVAASPLDGGVQDAAVRDAATDASADAGPALATEQRFERPAAPFATPAGVLFGDARGRVWRVGPSGVPEHIAGSGNLATGVVPSSGTGVTATLAGIGSVAAITADATGRVFIADRARHVVWSVGLETPPRARIVAGIIDREAPLSDVSAFGPEFLLAAPSALAYDGASTVFIADAAAHRVRALDVLTGQVTNVAGSGGEANPSPSGDFGPARMATLSRPSALAYDGGRLYVAEAGSGRVRVIRFPAR